LNINKEKSNSATDEHGLTQMIQKKRFNWLIQICYLCLSVAIIFSVSCAEMARDMGIDGATDVQLRSGLTGTQNAPAALDPFKKYELVMTANESRFFTMKVPVLEGLRDRREPQGKRRRPFIGGYRPAGAALGSLGGHQF
jgi:hypothetical protein